ncbi:hypothetical protein WJS89_05175 [Sphingomicrobium sp. XHP0235]|uniref:hypothetical protein n=1 Tax=Sphingomicrobium aquimarinum TaxID=3133971 RepID=UPI0031FED7CA
MARFDKQGRPIPDPARGLKVYQGSSRPARQGIDTFKNLWAVLTGPDTGYSRSWQLAGAILGAIGKGTTKKEPPFRAAPLS